MIPFKAFRTLVDVISGARDRATREHVDFMEFYLHLVQIMPNDIAKSFGSIPAPVLLEEKKKDFRIELTMTDFLWWKNAIMDEGHRFVESVDSVQRDIWDRLAKLVDTMQLSNEERGQLMEAIFETQRERLTKAEPQPEKLLT